MTARPDSPKDQSQPEHVDSIKDLFFHSTPKSDACQHDFKGWREFTDGNGGTTVCTKCGMTAFEHSLRYGP